MSDSEQQLNEFGKQVLLNHSKKQSEKEIINPVGNNAQDDQELSRADDEEEQFPQLAAKAQRGENKKATTKQSLDYFDPNQPFYSLEIAMKHRRATKVSKESIAAEEDEVLEYCPCCSTIVPGEDDVIPLFGDPIKDMSHLGPAYPLYFQFMRYSIVFLLIILCVSGIYNMVMNQNGDVCEKDKQCTATWIMSLAQSNRGGDIPDRTVAILNFAVTILLIGFAKFFRIRQKQVEKNIDKNDVSTQDYTIFVNHIPFNKTRLDIKMFFEDLVPGVRVQKVTQAFRLKTYNKMINDMLNAEEGSELKQQLKRQIEQYKIDCLQEADVETSFAGAAFVSFDKEEQAVRVVDHFKVPYFKALLCRKETDASKLFDGQALTVKHAHEPGDTNWEKIEYTNTEKFGRRIVTLLLTLVFLTGSFFAIFAISNAQSNLSSSGSSKTMIQVLSLLASLTTVGINQVFQFAIQIFADFESYNFKTDTVISIAQKSGLVQFVNTTVVQFSVSLIQNGVDVAIPGGLVNTITLLMLTNSVVPALINILSFEMISKWLFQRWFLWKSEEGKRKYTQMKVNTLFERPQMNAASCFASAANSLLLAGFYSYIIPIGLPLCIISLFLQLMINKFKLVRTQAMPLPLGSQLPAEMIDFYLEIIILFFAAGCMTFEFILYNETNAFTIAQVAIAAVCYFLPLNSIIDQLFDSSSNFVENPILKANAISKYIEYLKVRQEIEARNILNNPSQTLADTDNKQKKKNKPKNKRISNKVTPGS